MSEVTEYAQPAKLLKDEVRLIGGPANGKIVLKPTYAGVNYIRIFTGYGEHGAIEFADYEWNGGNTAQFYKSFCL